MVPALRGGTCLKTKPETRGDAPDSGLPVLVHNTAGLWEVCTVDKRRDYRVQAEKVETVSFMLPFVNSLSACTCIVPHVMFASCELRTASCNVPGYY